MDNRIYFQIEKGYDRTILKLFKNGPADYDLIIEDENSSKSIAVTKYELLALANSIGD